MRKRRRSRRQTIEGVVWTVVVGALAIGAIVVCARYQGNIRSSGMRLALIVAAVSLGAGIGIFADRLTASRRSSRDSGANRKTRRHIRTVTFAITGIVGAICIIARYMANHMWIALGAAAAVLGATWLWYLIECRVQSRGTTPGRLGDRDY